LSHGLSMLRSVATNLTQGPGTRRLEGEGERGGERGRERGEIIAESNLTKRMYTRRLPYSGKFSWGPIFAVFVWITGYQRKLDQQNKYNCTVYNGHDRMRLRKLNRENIEDWLSTKIGPHENFPLYNNIILKYHYHNFILLHDLTMLLTNEYVVLCFFRESNGQLNNTLHTPKSYNHQQNNCNRVFISQN
jgi:hypothetical protein